MRKLIIHREKAMAACLMKVHFYITNAYIHDENEKVVIAGEQCKKLGALKNGEEKTFMIGEESAKVFAVYDLSISTTWDEIKIPEGTEGIRISGKCMFAPSVGNPFNFHEEIRKE